jgi:hypothetical protein
MLVSGRWASSSALILVVIAGHNLSTHETSYQITRSGPTLKYMSPGSIKLSTRLSGEWIMLDIPHEVLLHVGDGTVIFGGCCQ